MTNETYMRYWITVKNKLGDNVLNLRCKYFEDWRRLEGVIKKNLLCDQEMLCGDDGEG